MLQRSHDRTIELDVELARKQSRENPVYYIQYAHARIASMLRRFPSGRVEAALTADWGAAPLEDPERDLIKKLVAFPGEIAEAAERRAPHRIAGYALELAQDFTAFYEACRVVGATPEPVESQRVATVGRGADDDRAVAGAARRERAGRDVATAPAGRCRGRPAEARGGQPRNWLSSCSRRCASAGSSAGAVAAGARAAARVRRRQRGSVKARIAAPNARIAGGIT